MDLSRLPISFLLYATSVGLTGVAGWQVCELVPLQKSDAKGAAAKRGAERARDVLSASRNQGLASADWRYAADNRSWWEEFKNANFLGKRPSPKVVLEPGAPKPPTKPTIVPLENIIELALLVYDGQDQGMGELSHVVVRYMPGANVTVPEWYVRHAQPQSEILLQKIWIKGEGDVRRDPHLWPPFENIRLVRVAADAQSAFFVRATSDGDKQEQLWKTAANMSQEVLRAIHALRGSKPVVVPNAVAQGTWIPAERTFVRDNIWNIGSADEESFSVDRFLEKVNFDTYRSSMSSRRGLIVRNVDPKFAARFGVSQGEVLLSVNGHEVRTEAQATQFGRKEHKKGVRTFVTVWLSGGREVERVYQLPDR